MDLSSIWHETPEPSITRINLKNTYHKISNISHTKLQSSNASCLGMQSSLRNIEARCSMEKEDVVGAAPTGAAPTTSEWSSILLPTKVRLILETWRYLKFQSNLPGTNEWHWYMDHIAIIIIWVLFFYVSRVPSKCPRRTIQKSSCEYDVIGHVTLVAINGTTILVPYHIVYFGHSNWFWRWDTHISLILIWFCKINSLRLTVATWRHRSGSTLAQVMACCLMAPSHYLNQC